MTDGPVTGLVPRHRQQVAALCWRRAPLLEVLLVTSLRTKRWILPKGWPQTGLTLAEAAAREALEEAGVMDEVSPDVIGHYHYLKEKGGECLPCRVEIFALHVTGQWRAWPEKGAREMAWPPLDQAARRVAEAGLRHLLLDFRKSPRAA